MRNDNRHDIDIVIVFIVDVVFVLDVVDIVIMLMFSSALWFVRTSWRVTHNSQSYILYYCCCCFCGGQCNVSLKAQKDTWGGGVVRG